MSSDVKLQKQLRYEIGLISEKLNLIEIIFFSKRLELDVKIERSSVGIGRL